MTRQSDRICQTCRARKVRCDGNRPTCGDCRRLDLDCSFQHPGSGVSQVPRRRARQACVRCHSRKARCSGGPSPCQRCREYALECVYPSPGRLAHTGPRRRTSHEGSTFETSNSIRLDYSPADHGSNTPSLGPGNPQYQPSPPESSGLPRTR